MLTSGPQLYLRHIDLRQNNVEEERILTILKSPLTGQYQAEAVYKDDWIMYLFRPSTCSEASPACTYLYQRPIIEGNTVIIWPRF